MPKSVPPAPWKPSRRGTPAIAAADVVAVVAGAGVITAVAVAPEPLGAGRAAWAVCARLAGGVAAGGALARGALDGGGGGAGAPPLFSVARTSADATTPPCVHLH